MFQRRIRSVFVVCLVATMLAPAAASQLGPPSSIVEHTAHDVQTSSVREVEKRPLGKPIAYLADRRAKDGDAKGEKKSSQLGISKTLGALVVVVGLMLILVMAFRWVSARKGGLIASLGPSGRAPSGVLEILARYPIACTQRLVLLRVGQRVILCCQTTGAKAASGAMTTLTELSDPEEVASILRVIRDQDGRSNRTAFKNALKDAGNRPEQSNEETKSVLSYESVQGDTVQWQDERVNIPAQSPFSAKVDPSVGRLRARLAAMRSDGAQA
jgi:flagellar biogenesis protein FliO